jgi:5-formyltetrahydrofolate cyclo-ligase
VPASKQEVRERVWALMQTQGVARFPGAPGRIPNFTGAEAAARQLAQTEEWATAATLKANPDAPQLPVRARGLSEGKTVFMAVPRLTDRLPFVRLDPGRLSMTPRKAASIRRAAKTGRAVSISRIPHIDLVVCGSVAVDRRGARVGKGGGYSDLELALLLEAGPIDDRTVIATTVHSLQVVDERLPETRHDFRVDLIVTAEEVIRPGARHRRRPSGIVWDHLEDRKIAEIPVLAALAGQRR